jgi:AraC-like DNA-binding protein
MQFDIAQLGAKEFRVDHILPEGFGGHRLAGARVLTAQHPLLGTIIQQEFINTHYSIRYHFFDVLEPFTLRGRQAAARLTSFLSVRSTMDYNIQGVGNLLLRQGQFALLHNEERPAVASFIKTKPHEFMEISWMDECLQSLFNPFRLLEKLFEPLSMHRHGFFLSPKPRPAGIQALDGAGRILNNVQDPAISRHFFETQTKEFLLWLLVESGKRETPSTHFTQQQRDLITAIGNRVLGIYDKEFQLADLAQEAGMNETSFKHGFREIFGDSFARMHMAARMNEARRLLSETKLSPKQIAYMVNYKLTTSFITRFREHFNYPPSAVPRNGMMGDNE